MNATILFGSIIFVFFAAQLICCRKFKKIAVKAVPLYFILLLFLVALLLLLYEIFRTTHGGVAIYEIFAFITACGAGIALIGDIMAWIVYGIMQRRKRGNL